MNTNHPAARALKKLGALEVAKPVVILDSAKKKGVKILDDIDGDDDATQDAAAVAAYSYINLNAVALVQEWAATNAADLDEGETLASRLISLLVGVADQNQNGELTDEESDVTAIAMNAAFDYLVSKGVSEADASALLNDEDDDAAKRIAEFLNSVVPTDEVAAAADVDDFVFDPEDQGSMLDSVRAKDILDSVFKRRLVSGGAKKINKHVTGHVVLSSKHKVSIRKAHIATHHASSLHKRLK